ncbi:MAG: hypothetical protein LBB88_01725 [Planctomycetaceae bacterium]|nr:hypothetical protein [Planctomycetaceae bacterium]
MSSDAEGQYFIVIEKSYKIPSQDYFLRIRITQKKSLLSRFKPDFQPKCPL